jgi:ABC-type glycerol-3-phosphate transport system substrate-binding protein
VLYALPVGVYTNIVAVNLDLLAQRGIAPPGPSWTMDQALDIAQRVSLRGETEETSIWGIDHPWEIITHFVYSWIRGNGGEPLVPNEDIATARWAADAETVQTIQWLVDLTHKRGVMPLKGAGITHFTEGRNALGVMETQNMVYIKDSQTQRGTQFKWDVQHMPIMKRGRYYPDRGFAYGIGRTTRNADLAFALLKDIVGPAGQTDWYRQAAHAPSIKSLLNGAFLQEKEPPANRKAIVEAIQSAKAMPKSERFWDMDRQVVIKVLADLRAGKVSVQEGLTTMDHQSNVMLKKQ